MILKYLLSIGVIILFCRCDKDCSLHYSFLDEPERPAELQSDYFATAVLNGREDWVAQYAVLGSSQLYEYKYFQFLVYNNETDYLLIGKIAIRIPDSLFVFDREITINKLTISKDSELDHVDGAYYLREDDLGVGSYDFAENCDKSYVIFEHMTGDFVEGRFQFALTKYKTLDEHPDHLSFAEGYFKAYVKL